jgi:hypothetical protein
MNRPSLGVALLDDEQFKDFQLLVYDGTHTVTVLVHRLVLKTCSPYFRQVLGGNYYFFYKWTVPDGYIVPALRLVKFMYTNNHDDLGDPSKTQDLSTMLMLGRETLVGGTTPGKPEKPPRPAVTVTEEEDEAMTEEEYEEEVVFVKRVRPPTRSQVQMVTRSGRKRRRLLL